MTTSPMSIVTPIIGGTAYPTSQNKRATTTDARVPTPKFSHARECRTKADEIYNKNLPALYKIKRFYLPSEVASHCTSDDCWVSLFNMVFDLTKLIANNSANSLCDPLVLVAG